jgi:hypothetical protein
MAPLRADDDEVLYAADMAVRCRHSCVCCLCIQTKGLHRGACYAQIPGMVCRLQGMGSMCSGRSAHRLSAYKMSTSIYHYSFWRRRQADRTSGAHALDRCFVISNYSFTVICAIDGEVWEHRSRYIRNALEPLTVLHSRNAKRPVNALMPRLKLIILHQCTVQWQG